ELRELLGEGGVDLGVAVADRGGPQGGDAVEVAAALDVDQPGPLGAFDHGGLVLDPVGVLGERVPDGGGVAGDPGGGVPRGSGGRIVGADDHRRLLSCRVPTNLFGGWV